MKNIFLFITLLILALPFSTFAQNQDWYFPIGNYSVRSSHKMFGQYFDKSSYLGKEALFPTQYTGYHAATDWEILPGEENAAVSVHAVTDGKVAFIGPVGGYGGVILLNLANDSHTAIYGHLKLSSSTLKAGDSVKAGQFLANLGKGFSNETGGERKHLHFGIYNGKGAYFKGYEVSQQVIQSKWIDPVAYLKDKGAGDISGQLSVPSDQKANINQNSTVDKGNTNLNTNNNFSDYGISTNQSDQNLSTQVKNVGFMESILQYIENIFSKIRSIL